MGTTWKLMSDQAITSEQRAMMAAFLVKESKLTQGEYIKKFEDEWSSWQGCRYSVFVNSGSSANLLLLDVMKELYGKGLVVCQGNTWATNVSPVVQLGMNLQLVDCDYPEFFRPSLEKLKWLNQRNRIKYLFITHILGYPALTEDIIEFCNDNDIIILEDCCESHGAKMNNKKVGNIGLGSTFSFYYGHHMTTVEGGMICTNNKILYKLLLLKRSHGMLNELRKYGFTYHDIEGIDPRFTFLTTGYNVRGQEINGYLGSMQLQNLDEHIHIRNNNWYQMMFKLDRNKYMITIPSEDSLISNYALPIISLRENINKVKEMLNVENVEWRPIIAGNLFRHPFMQSINQYINQDNLEFFNSNGIYIGNHQEVTQEQVATLVGKLNAL